LIGIFLPFSVIVHSTFALQLLHLAIGILSMCVGVVELEAIEGVAIVRPAPGDRRRVAALRVAAALDPAALVVLDHFGRGEWPLVVKHGAAPRAGGSS
jgi:hypothetical protein